MASKTKLSSGKWLIRWRELPSPECPSGQRTQTVDDEEAAKDALAEAELIEAQLKVEARRRGVTREQLVERSKTFRELGDAWVASFTRRNTKTANEVRLRVHIYPVIGDRPVIEILPSELLAVIASWRGLARSTQVANWRAMAAVFNWAVSERLLTPQENPAKASSIRPRIPTLPKGQTPDAWDEAWVREMYANIRPDCSIFVLLAAYCGLRQGEIFGLSPDDFAVDDKGVRIVRVKRQVLLDNNSPYFGPPKHRKDGDDPREIEVPPFVWDAIEEHMADHPPREVRLPYDKGDGSDVEDLTVGLLMVTREKGAWNRNYFNPYIWKPALKASGIPVIRSNSTHALRHWFAVDFMYHNGSLGALSKVLGHYDRGFTLKIYQRFDRRGVADVTSARDAAGRKLLSRDAASERADAQSPALSVPAAAARAPGSSPPQPHRR